jgi:hypothetical protein
LHLSCLFVSTIFINTSKRWLIELVPEPDHAGQSDISPHDMDGFAFVAGNLFGSNFNIQLLDRNEENYTREANRSE